MDDLQSRLMISGPQRDAVPKREIKKRYRTLLDYFS